MNNCSEKSFKNSKKAIDLYDRLEFVSSFISNEWIDDIERWKSVA